MSDEPSRSEHEVPADRLRRSCDLSVFPFETTAESSPLVEVVGQDRAVRAIRFGLDVPSAGFNLFLAGQPGTGKSSVLRRILADVAKERPTPDDTLYVQNFVDPDVPRVMRLPAGTGARLRDDMDELLQALRELIPKSFEGKEYEDQKHRMAESSQKRKQELLEGLEADARSSGFSLNTTASGVRAVPTREGEPMTQEAFDALDEREREAIAAGIEKFQKRILDFMSDVKDVDRALMRELRELDRMVAMNVLGALFRELRDRYESYEKVGDYLEQAQQHILANIDSFRSQDDGPAILPGMTLPRKEPDFSQYKVHLIVDNSGLQGAPFVFETNPTYPNLVGRVERRAQFGALVTDFTMIRAGSLARANGGYLVLEVEEVLRNPFVYEALKRAIRNQEVRIEDVAERSGFFSSQSLRPEPIPLEVKVCLVGNPWYYHLLYAYDEDFRESFKVKADFDYESDRNDGILLDFAAFITRLVDEEKLLPFDRSAVGAVIDEASRWAEDQKKISLKFDQIDDLVRQAAYWAGKAGAEIVSGAHVERTIGEIEYRQSLVKERVQELMRRDILTVFTDGGKVGEINGLAVHMLGDYLFGRPTRITAAAYVGNDGVINIERRVNLSHSSHDKGVLILSGFLSRRFAQERPLSVSVSIAFEQSYSEVSGDSASSTELYALLSALSGVPIRQGIAVTGSVNQKGQVQAIGGVNHKIEGFFDICEARGLTGEQGVIIPAANLEHLMLRPRVVQAVEQGRFHVWAVKHVDQGIEILTGIPVGEEDGESGQWTHGSMNDLVARRLRDFEKRLQSARGDGGPGQTEIMLPRDFGGELPPPPRPPGRPQG